MNIYLSRFCSEALSSVQGAFRSFGPSCSETWETVRRAIKVIEPYQPTIAGGLILAKLGWRIYKQKPLLQEIKKTEQQLARYSAILKFLSKSLQKKEVERGKKPATQKEMIQLSQRIENIRKVRGELQADLAEKKRQMSYTVFTFGQLPSLFFDHPGSNIYQTMHHLIGRWMQLHHVTHPIRPVHSSRIRNALSLAAGIISMAGTAASFGRMSGVVAKDNRMSHLFSMLAIGVHALEGGMMAISTIKSSRETIAKYLQEHPSLNKRLKNLAHLVERSVLISGGAAFLGQMMGVVDPGNFHAQILSGIALGICGFKAAQICWCAAKRAIQRKSLLRQNHSY